MSRHIDERLLNDLLAGELSLEQEREVEAHLRFCVPCVRQLDEWRRVFPQIKRIIPTAPHAAIPVTRHRGLEIIVPAPRPGRHRRTMVPALVVVLLATLGGSYYLGLRRPGTEALQPPLPDSTDTNPALPAGPPPMTDDAPPVRAVPERDAPESARGAAFQRQAPSNAATAPPATAAQRDTAASPPDSEPESSEPIEPGEALALMNGNVRLLDGRWPGRVLRLKPGLVPGASAGAPVIRLVYVTTDGTLIVDEQRADVAGYDGIEIGSTPAGVSVARWTDPSGIWITVAAVMPDSLLLGLRPRMR